MAQDDGGSEGTLVEVLGRIEPPLGIAERFAVRAMWRRGRLTAASMDSFARPGDRGAITVLDVSDGTLPPAFTYARWPEVRVTSLADPTGRADTSLGVPLVSRFGVSPPVFGSVGALEAVVLDDPALAMLRSGGFRGAEAALDIPVVQLSDLRAGAYPDGQPVAVEAVQVTPFSRERRFVLLAEEDGSPGVWLDGEGFGAAVGAYGERGVWFGEVRRDQDVVYLRSWVSRTRLRNVALAEAQVDGDPPDGAVVSWVLAEVGAPDRFGRVPVGAGWRMDARFRSLDGYAAGDTITAAVWRRGEDRRLLPLPELSPPDPDDTDAPADDTDLALDTDVSGADTDAPSPQTDPPVSDTDPPTGA